MADPFHSRPVPPRNAGNRARQRTASASANAPLPLSASTKSMSRDALPEEHSAPRSSLDGFSSTDALLTHLNGLLNTKTNEIQLAGRLGETLLAQQAELESRIRDLEAAAGGYMSAADDKRSRALGASTSSDPMRVNDDVREKLESLEAEMAQWERDNEEMYRNAGITKPSTAESSKPESSAAASRRDRNNAPARNGDVELATEIGQSLLIEVRRLQALLTERDEQLNSEREARDILEHQHETATAALKANEADMDKFKEENWNLELAIQELRGSHAEATDSAQRAESERARLTKTLATTRENYDATRAEADRHLATIETLRSKHETSMAEARKNAATLQREKIDLQQVLETTQAQMNARNIRRSVSVGIESPNTSLRVPARAAGVEDEMDEDSLEGEDPFLGKSANRPRGSVLPTNASPAPSLHTHDSPMVNTNDVGQLKQALVHRQKTIETLRAALQREKEARLRGKRAAEDDDAESADGSPVQARKVSRRGAGRRGASSIRSRMPGRRTQLDGEEIEEVDDFEDDGDSISMLLETLSSDRHQDCAGEAPENLDAAFAARGIKSSSDLDESFNDSLQGDRMPSGRRNSQASMASNLSRAVFTTMPDFASDSQAEEHAAELAALTEAHQSALNQARDEHESTVLGLKDGHSAAITSLKEQHLRALDEAATQSTASLDALRAAHRGELDSLTSTHQSSLRQRDAAGRELQDAHAVALAQLRDSHVTASAKAAAEHEEKLATLRREHQQEVNDLRAQLKRAIDERDEALRRLREEHAKGIDALKATHSAALIAAATAHTSELERLRAQHAQGLADSQSAMRADYDATSRALVERHQRALEDAAAEQEASLSKQSTLHATALHKLRVDLGADSDAAQESLKTEHAKQLEEEASRFAEQLAAKTRAHEQELLKLSDSHAAVLEQRDAKSRKDLADLHDRLSQEQEAALAAAAANDEQASAISKLKQVHARALEEASTAQRQEVAALREAHGMERTKMRNEHVEALQQQSAKSSGDLEALRQRLISEHQSSLAATSSKHTAHAQAASEQHQQQLQALRAEYERAFKTTQREHESALQSAQADLSGKHANAVKTLRDEHVVALARQTKDSDAASTTLREQHATALASLRAEHSTALTKEHSARQAADRAAQDSHRRALAESESRHKHAVAQVLGAHQRELAALVAAHELALANVRKEAETAAQAARDEETDGETEFEDAAETLGIHSTFATAPRRPSIDVSTQTDELAVSPSAAASTRRDSKDTFGGRASALGNSTAGPVFVQTIGEERSMSPDRPERAESIISLASSTNTMLPPPVPVIKANADKSKPPVLSMPPPPTVPPPRSVSPRKSTASSKSTARMPPPRPISPPPADLLQRATSPGLLMPTTARQESVGGKGPSPIKRPRAAASVPSLVPSVKSPRAAQSVSEFGTYPRTNKLRSSDASSASGASRRSRAQSVASSRTSEDDHSTYGGSAAPPLPGASWGPQSQGTDPAIIRAITQTMIGEFMYKYMRKPFGKGLSENRHKRFFWVHPYTKTLYWSPTDPAGQYSAHEQTSKSVFIEGIHEVYDPNPSPPGLCQMSLVITTPGRDIKLTAPTQERHDMWYQAINYLLARPEADTPASPASQMSTFSSSFAAGRASTSTGMYRQTSSPSRRKMYSMSAASDSKLASSKSPASQSMSRFGSRSKSRMSAASAMHLKRADTPAAQYLQEAAEIGSPRSVRSFGGDDTVFNDDSFEHVNAAEISYEQKQVDDDEDDGYEGLENVRVCCGEHDVGRLSRQSRHSHGAHEHHHHHHHSHRPTSPALSDSRRSGRKSITSLWSQKTAELPPPLPAYNPPIGLA